jgi:hypothetical protein
MRRAQMKYSRILIRSVAMSRRKAARAVVVVSRPRSHRGVADRFGSHRYVLSRVVVVFLVAALASGCSASSPAPLSKNAKAVLYNTHRPGRPGQHRSSHQPTGPQSGRLPPRPTATSRSNRCLLTSIPRVKDSSRPDKSSSSMAAGMDQEPRCQLICPHQVKGPTSSTRLPHSSLTRQAI